MRYSFNKEDIVNIIDSCNSMSDLVVNLGYHPNNSNYRKRLKQFCLDNEIILHWALQPSYIKAEEREVREPRKVLYKILIEAGVEEICTSCGVGTEYNNKRLVLAIDHKNGNSYDNSLENLRFLCGNCHSQTDSYTGGNIIRNGDQAKTYCLRCGEYSLYGNYCRACRPYVSNEEAIAKFTSLTHLVEEYEKYGKNSYRLAKVYGVGPEFISNRILSPERYDENDPYSLPKVIRRKSHLDDHNLVEMLNLIRDNSFLFASKYYKVSDNTIRKHLIRRNILPALVRKMSDEDFILLLEKNK